MINKQFPLSLQLLALDSRVVDTDGKPGGFGAVGFLVREFGAFVMVVMQQWRSGRGWLVSERGQYAKRVFSRVGWQQRVVDFSKCSE